MGDMVVVTVRFSIGGQEAEALQRLANQELRTPREQVRYLLRQELLRLGLLEEKR